PFHGGIFIVLFGKIAAQYFVAPIWRLAVGKLRLLLAFCGAPRLACSFFERFLQEKRLRNTSLLLYGGLILRFYQNIKKY
ncbi:MAG: hypothetical protein J6B55_08740, partial [Clostridia bacterium]|nr:hypothetical protein [Clostridia bacterium]